MPLHQTRTVPKSLIYHCSTELVGSVVTATLRYPKEFGYTAEFKIRTKLRKLNEAEVWLLRSDSDVALQVQTSSYGNLPVQDVITGTHRQRQTVIASNLRLAPSLGRSLFSLDHPVAIWLWPASPFGTLGVGDKAGLRSTDGYIRGMADIVDLQVTLHHSATR